MANIPHVDPLKVQSEHLREQTWALVADLGIVEIIAVTQGMIASQNFARAMANLVLGELIFRHIITEEEIIRKIREATLEIDDGGQCPPANHLHPD